MQICLIINRWTQFLFFNLLFNIKSVQISANDVWMTYETNPSLFWEATFLHQSQIVAALEWTLNNN